MYGVHKRLHIVLVEPSERSELPDQILVTSRVHTVPSRDNGWLTLKVKNECTKFVTLQPGLKMAVLHSVDYVARPYKVMDEQDTIDANLFNFGSSTIPPHWKDRLRQRLTERAKVFSFSEWDVGCARGVEHCLRFTDDHPFRERSCRIAPADVTGVRKYLQELLAA